MADRVWILLAPDFGADASLRSRRPRERFGKASRGKLYRRALAQSAFADFICPQEVLSGSPRGWINQREPGWRPHRRRDATFRIRCGAGVELANGRERASRVE